MPYEGLRVGQSHGPPGHGGGELARVDGVGPHRSVRTFPEGYHLVEERPGPADDFGATLWIVGASRGPRAERVGAVQRVVQ
jgi:hypothetical protein